MPLKPAGFLRPGGTVQPQITGRPRTCRLTRHSGSIEHYRCLASRRSRLWYYYRPLSRGASRSGLPTQDRILFSEPTISGCNPHIDPTAIAIWSQFSRALSLLQSPATVRPGRQGILVLTARRQPETVIVSEEYGRQIRPGRLVVQPRGHHRHWLDDPKAILV